ncbi:coiled-coil domain-containing protein 7-like [Molossus molossus]|uniref:coiled-coil domain-containing protein 7-like n=1 Tax=Molossus molossus TaxID=27622 RepID=UPI001747412F|nr:coiled-coil domain-containing protein 7-like [Molossus molossus]
MKPVKHLLSSSNKLASVPELSHKKGLLNSPLSPKLKEKQSSKSVCDKLEMVLRSPPTGESVVRYALPIPSSKTKELIAEDELLRKTTEHLKTIVSSLEETYGICNENVEKPVVKSEQEELSLSVGDDLNLFLECCSQFAAQLEGTVKEERHILESLFKWFQRQVNQMEEISKDQSFSEAEFPEPDRKVALNIAQVGKQIQKLEELKNRLKEGSKKSLKAMMSKIKNSEYSSEAVQSYENVQQKIEEFIRTHSAEELIDVSATESQTTYSIPDRLNAMMKIFEKQSNTLERTKNDKILLETKYKQIQNDFQLLLEEKSVLENELQKLRNTETTKSTYDRTKKTMKMEKKKAKEKSEDSEAKQLKMEEFLKAKKTIYALETENKILQEQLKQALQVSIVHDGSTIENRSKKKGASTAISDISQILKSQDGSAFLKSSNEVSADEDLSPLSPSKPHDKSFTRELLSKDIKGLLSVGTLLPGNETVTTSFISPPVVTERKPVGSAISKAYILEEKLQSKTETQTYQEERKFQDHGQVPDENPVLEHQGSMSNTQLQVKKHRLSKGGRLNTYATLPDENRILENEESMTKPQMQEKKQRTSTEKTLTATQDKVPDENRMLEHQDTVSKSEIHMKNQRTHKKKGLTTYATLPDENRILENEESMTKPQMQEKKQRTSTEKTLTASKYKEIAETCKIYSDQGRQGEKCHGAYATLPDENRILENEESMTKPQMQEKKQRTSTEKTLTATQDKVPDENRMLEHQDTVSKSEIHMKNQRTHKKKGLTNEDSNELSNGNFTVEDLELATQRLSGMYDIQEHVKIMS